METMANDEWVRAAMTDDLMVVELLIRLKQSQDASASASASLSLSPKSYPLPFTWGLKQPRSRLTTFSRRKGADSTRCSPTTPLSWSGGASPSVTADGYEDSSRPSVVSHQASRSKATATATSEYTGNSSTTKRCRRKKEIANLNATFKEQRARNESLKRMKLDLAPNSKNNPGSTSDEYPLSKVQTDATEDDTEPQSDSKAARTESTGESVFLVPDLNMMPSEGDSLVE